MGEMLKKIHIRPQVLLIICILGMGLGMALLKDQSEVATGCVVSMSGFATKLIEIKD